MNTDSSTSDLYRMGACQTRWASFENPTGGKGKGGMVNHGAKGDPCRRFGPGESKVLLDVQGCGIIRRIWMTMFDKSPKMLRGFRLDMYWDGAKTPAVSVPMGCFFGHCGNGMATFDSDLFSSPHAKSFNCLIPMPFRKSARIVLTNETDADQHAVFYDVDYTLCEELPVGTLYFHAHWHRENPTTLGRDFEILPLVAGKGRFLGANVTVATLNRFGVGVEGEVKMYLDGDREFPTLAGTGTEDYIGDGWGADTFAHRYQGCVAAGDDLLAFYRYHVPDPVYFHSDCRVTIQQMAGGDRSFAQQMADAGVPYRIVAASLPEGRILGLIDSHPDLEPQDAPDAFLMILTCFDVSATAYFYLDSPENGLPPLQSVEERSV